MSGDANPSRHDELLAARAALERERERHRELFETTPAAHLVTDLGGTVSDANLEASRLLKVTPRALLGRSLPTFVDGEYRAAFRERLHRAADLEDAGAWLLRLRRRGAEPARAAAAVSVVRDDAGRPLALRWLLLELPSATRAPLPRGDPPEPLDHALEQVVWAAVALLRADHAGLMLLDEAGAPRWVLAAGTIEVAFERVRDALAAGPCAEAMRRGRPVWTRDVGTDPRWPALAAVALDRKDLHGMLAAGIAAAGRPAGAFVALALAARVWSESDLAAGRAFAAVVGQLLRGQGPAG